MENGYIQRRQDNIWQDIGGEVVILDETGTQICLLNETAALIWTLADGTRTITEIANDVCERFQVSPQEDVADVHEFSAQLLEAGLVELHAQPLVTREG